MARPHNDKQYQRPTQTKRPQMTNKIKLTIWEGIANCRMLANVDFQLKAEETKRGDTIPEHYHVRLGEKFDGIDVHLRDGLKPDGLDRGVRTEVKCRVVTYNDGVTRRFLYLNLFPSEKEPTVRLWVSGAAMEGEMSEAAARFSEDNGGVILWSLGE